MRTGVVFSCFFCSLFFVYYIYIVLFYKLCNDSEKRVNICIFVKEIYLEFRIEVNLLKLINVNVFICILSY